QETHAQAVVVGHREDVDRLPALRGAILRLIEGGGSVGRSVRARRRQCRGDRKGAHHVWDELAVEAEALVARRVYHDISLRFCSVIHWVGEARSQETR